jgi:hypothetical protein
MSRSSKRECSRLQFCNLKETGRWWNLLTYLLWKTTGKHNWGGDVFSRLALWTYLTHADKESETETQSPCTFCVPVRTFVLRHFNFSDPILTGRESAAEYRHRWKKIRPAPFKKFSDPILAGRARQSAKKNSAGKQNCAIPRLQGLRRVCGNLDPENVSPIEVTSSLPAGWMGPADRHARSSYGAGGVHLPCPHMRSELETAIRLFRRSHYSFASNKSIGLSRT